MGPGRARKHPFEQQLADHPPWVTTTDQTRAVIDGLEADLVQPDWKKELPNESIITHAVAAFFVRQANPKTSVSGRWNFLGIGGSVSETGGSDDKGRKFVIPVDNNVDVLPKDAREAADFGVGRPSTRRSAAMVASGIRSSARAAESSRMEADVGAASVTVPLPPVVLTIGGSDSGGGAGVQADLKTFMGLRVHGCCALTCITAQNTCGVTAVAAVDVALLQAQVQAVVADLPVAALKTGMLLDADRIIATADLLAPLVVPRVVDPVMVSRHGAVLLDPAAITALRRQLLPLADLLTPNVHEAQLLWGQSIDDGAAMERAAAAIAQLGPAAVLIKGGGLPEFRGHDVLWHDGELHWFRDSAIATRHSHGSGCTLSAAITARFAHGDDLPTAIARARAYVRQGLTWSLAIGQGQGPLGHWPPSGRVTPPG